MNSKTYNAICDGELNLNDITIFCSVLEDNKNTRVISKTEVIRALGRSEGGSKRGKAKLPRFISARNINPYISKDLEKAILYPIIYKTTKGNIAHGLPSTILPELCSVWLKAKIDGKLTDSQLNIAKSAEIIMRGLATVGITALIDEATGFQDLRAKKALAEIFEKYIAKELQEWTKTFPDEFYKQMFRLKNWPYEPKSVKRPSVIGKYTNDIVYERLAPKVLGELKAKTPKTKGGHRRYRYFQWLTGDIGHPKLREHIASVMALMRASSSWNGFMRLLNRAFTKYGDTLEIPFDYGDEE